MMAAFEIIIKKKNPNLAPTRFASPSMFSVPITFVFIVCKVIMALQISLARYDRQKELSTKDAWQELDC